MRLTAAVVLAFAASLALTIFASISAERPPAVIGIIDVGLALLLLLLLVLLRRGLGARITAADKASAYDAVSIIAALPLLLLGAFFLDLGIKWHVLLPGLAWRSWYLISILPYLTAAHRLQATPVEHR